MHEFRGHVRLPKVDDQATYIRPSDRKWASFLPILELSFEAKVEVLGAWSFWSLDSPHLRVRDRTNPRSSRGVDLRRGV
ncbi:hypothetical protein MANES_05G133326v8 [Manihot esculenta]|uniref:Uncharacterized protein n=1 Tax=Manihot esculenta TaxID=3983 RepID=A0ACB7HQV9_MANES|nr:hypothetical protein MANES_05G133326v8 [Manihot esculenta]